MADVKKVKDAVKETLLGAENVPDIKITGQSKDTFEKYAQTDGESGELYMSEEDFVNAVAPVGEDYVSNSFSESHEALQRPLIDGKCLNSTKSNANNMPSFSR